MLSLADVWRGTLTGVLAPRFSDMSDTMSLVRAVLSTAAGAVVIWLTVKFVNRRKNVARRLWILAGALYLLSIGPMGRVSQELDAEWMMYAYYPIILVAHEFRPLGEALLGYLAFCGVKIG